MVRWKERERSPAGSGGLAVCSRYERVLLEKVTAWCLLKVDILRCI